MNQEHSRIYRLFGYNKDYEFHGPLELIFEYHSVPEIIDTFFLVCSNFYLASIQSFWKRNISPDEVGEIFTKNPSEFIVKLFYEYQSFDFSLNDNEMFIYCCKKRYIELVRSLVRDQRVNIFARNHLAMKYASKHNHADIIEILLPELNDINDYLIISCSHNSIDVVKLLLSDTRFGNISNIPLVTACKLGYCDLVRVLVGDNRIDPSADNNRPIIVAAYNGHYNVIKLLLSDPHVNPSDLNNEALKVSAQNGHYRVFKMLINDELVDPCVNKNCPLKYACLNGHLEVVKVLIDDKRVDLRECDVFHWARYHSRVIYYIKSLVMNKWGNLL